MLYYFKYMSTQLHINMTAIISFILLILLFRKQQTIISKKFSRYKYRSSLPSNISPSHIHQTSIASGDIIFLSSMGNWIAFCLASCSRWSCGWNCGKGRYIGWNIFLNCIDISPKTHCCDRISRRVLEKIQTSARLR